METTAGAVACRRLGVRGRAVLRGLLRSGRARLLAVVPSGVRARLRRRRDGFRRLEARLRARLPEPLGGAIAAERLTAQLLDDVDRAALTALFELPTELFAQTPLQHEQLFVMGLRRRSRLIAAGFCRGLGEPARPFRRALFYADYVHPSWRRRQVGRVLHRARLAHLQVLGAEQVFAWVSPANPAALASLQACGFRQVARQPLWGQPTPAHLLLCCTLQPAQPGARAAT